MKLTLVTAPTVLPVSLTDAKAWCRVDTTADDAALGLMIKAACQQAAHVTGLALGEGEWRADATGFDAELDIDLFPVLSIDAVSYLDLAGDSQTLDSATYLADLISRPARIVLVDGEAWPETADQPWPVSVAFTAGHTAATLPDDIRVAILGAVAQWYDERVVGRMPSGSLELLRAWRRVVI